MRILITGAAGFAGSFLIERLPQGHDIHGTWRPNTPAPETTNRVVWHAMELTDGQAVAECLAEVRPDQIYHLAGAPSVETSFKNAVPHMEINAMGTSYLFDAIRGVGLACRTLVITSAQIYADSSEPLHEDSPQIPQSPYGLTKLAQDQLAQHAAHVDGLDVSIARPFNHIGPRQTAGFAIARFARHIARVECGLEPPVLAVGNLDARRDMTDVRDVADAYVRIMDQGARGRAYNVASGQAWRIGDLLDRLLHQSTVPIRVEVDPTRLRPVDVPVIVGDATRLRNDLGWSPSRTIDRTLADTLDWWRETVANGRDTTAA